MNKILFSGIQPTGIVHIGNLAGALWQWVRLQESYASLFCIVDLHAMTVFQDPKELSHNREHTARTLLALGVNPKKATLFFQSNVEEHALLYWILGSLAKMSELELMTQYKDKIQQGKAPLMGLFSYPVLMAADILLYDTAVVPVGEDQVQHVELARELARRFNGLYGKTFVEPKALIQKTGARIMGLDDPTKKMSKSASSRYNFIALSDTKEMIEEKIKKAVTDSRGIISYDPQKQPGISNLLSILSVTSNTPLPTLEKRFKNENYGTFKKEVAASVCSFVNEFQKKYRAISASYARRVLSQGAKTASILAQKKMDVVRKRVGLV